MPGSNDSPSLSVRLYELPPISRDDQAPVAVRVVYTCPHCAHPLRIRPEYFGSPLACRRCDRAFVPSLARAVSSHPGRPPLAV